MYRLRIAAVASARQVRRVVVPPARHHQVHSSSSSSGRGTRKDSSFVATFAWMSGVTAVAATCLQSNYSTISVAKMEEEKDDGEGKKDDGGGESSPSFDISELFKKGEGDGAKEFWDKIFQTDVKEKKDSSGGLLSRVADFFTRATGKKQGGGGGDPTSDARSNSDIVAKLFLKMLTGSVDDKKKAVADIVAKIRDRSGEGAVEEKSTLPEIYDMLIQYKDALGDVADKFFGDIDFSRLTPTGLLYYVEYEDEVKNSSWKRRMHRFFHGIDVSKVDELYEALILGELSYADTVGEIRNGLKKHSKPYELVYCNVCSEPGKPAHFVAVQRDQPDGFFERDTLHVVLVVRGTKTLADAVTDLLCDTEEYKGGMAHSFILGSGRYLADTHRELLLDLLESSGRSKVDLRIVGHSLGAGAASIAAIEINGHNDSRIRAQVVGFGCPALLSEELAEEADYITTVVNDADIVPRMSGATVANLLLDMLQFDWLPYAKADIQHTLTELQTRQPTFFNKDVTDKISSTVEPMLEQVLEDTLLDKTEERLDVELFPPGRCIHLYRDGVGISGCYVPNTFFSEIELSRRMTDDHLFHTGYQKTLLEVVRQQTGDHHFHFEEDVSPEE